MKKILQRLVEFIKYKEISYHAFDVAIGASNGYIGKQIKNNGSIGSDIIEKIHEVYSELSLNWLLTGDGEMILNNNKKPGELLSLNEATVSYKKVVEDKDKTIEVLNELVITLKDQINEANKNTETYRNLLNASVKGK